MLVPSSETVKDDPESKRIVHEDDLALARRVVARESEAMDDLVGMYADYLKRLLGPMTAWSPDTDDILQETFLLAWRKMRSYRGDASLKSWLTTIAIRACRNHARSLQRFTRALQSMWVERVKRSPNLDIEDDRWQIVQHAMQQLSPSDREVVVLIHVEHMSLAEAAAHLELRINTVEVRLHRARQRLKQLIPQL